MNEFLLLCKYERRQIKEKKSKTARTKKWFCRWLPQILALCKSGFFFQSSPRSVAWDEPQRLLRHLQACLRNADSGVCVSPSRVWRAKRRSQEMGQCIRRGGWCFGGEGGGNSPASEGAVPQPYGTFYGLFYWGQNVRSGLFTDGMRARRPQMGQRHTVWAPRSVQFWWKQVHTEHTWQVEESKNCMIISIRNN